MGFRIDILVLLAIAGQILGLGSAARADSADNVKGILAHRYDTLSKSQQYAVKGRDGWYFLTSELRSYSRGPFWGKAAAKASAATADQDPLQAIVSFDAMVKKAGIRLLIVPVPGKVAVYGDQLDSSIPSGERWDRDQQDFNAVLSNAGVEVLDLVPSFIDLRKKGVSPYARQDSHWSPEGMRLAAEKIAAWVKQQEWYGGMPKQAASMTPAVVHVRGDLAEMLHEDSVAKETLKVLQVRLGGEFVPSDVKSPVVLMGDSHTLVYHGFDLLAEHAGLSDLLCADLGFPVDLVGVMGSGANGSRMNLARRRDNLAGKTCLIWVFAARELTESPSGWKQIPVIR